jgi:hypothetical protein
LEEILVNLLINNDQKVTIRQNSQILSALNHLTYFATKSIHHLIAREDFIDYLRRNIEKLPMDLDDHISYFN